MSNNDLPETEETTTEHLTNLPQAVEIILPVMMRKGSDLAQLGDAVFNPAENKMVVHFNTKEGRDIAEFIGTGALSAVSFTGMMSRNNLTNKLN
jgi:hypothetical protein